MGKGGAVPATPPRPHDAKANGQKPKTLTDPLETKDGGACCEHVAGGAADAGDAVAPGAGAAPAAGAAAAGAGASPASARTTALLVAFDADRYDIEWGGFLTNHLAHGLISLAVLGAEPQLLRRFNETYSHRLTQRRPPTPRSSARIKQSSLRTLPLGRRQFFSAIERAFDRDTKGATPTQLRAVVAAHLPRLIDGLGGAAFHSLLHLGTGMRMECRSLVTEGLAYLAHSFLPVGGAAALGLGNDAVKEQTVAGVLECCEAVRREGRLQQRLVDAWPTVSGLPTGYFQRCMHVFAAVDGGPATAAAVAELRSYAVRSI